MEREDVGHGGGNARGEQAWNKDGTEQVNNDYVFGSLVNFGCKSTDSNSFIEVACDPR